MALRTPRWNLATVADMTGGSSIVASDLDLSRLDDGLFLPNIAYICILSLYAISSLIFFSMASFYFRSACIYVLSERFVLIFSFFLSTA